MLVLSRFPKQTIMIGNDISVTILKVDGKSVSVGIEAPQDVRVDRKEIYLRRKEEAERSE